MCSGSDSHNISSNILRTFAANVIVTEFTGLIRMAAFPWPSSSMGEGCLAEYLATFR